MSVPSPGCSSAIWSRVNSPCLVRLTIGFSSAMRICVIRAFRQINAKQSPDTRVSGLVNFRRLVLGRFVGLRTHGFHVGALAAGLGLAAVRFALCQLVG